jgi:hypothetical protein
MNRQIAVLLVLVILAVGCSSRTPDAAVTETTEPSSPSESASVASPLEGEWDTGPYPADRAPAAIVAAGYSDEASADEAVGGERRFECNFLFYEEGGVPFVAVRCWDPDERGTEPPLESDHGPYQLLPNDRLKLACDTCDVGTNYNLFSYELHGETLTLRYIRTVDPDLNAKELRYEAPFRIVWTVAPLQTERLASRAAGHRFLGLD